MTGWRRWFICVALLISAVAPVSARALPQTSLCAMRSFDGSTFTTCRLDTRHQEARLSWTDSRNSPLRSFGHLAAILPSNGRKVQFAFNAGMFDANGTPIGLFVENGSQRTPLNLAPGTGNFYLKPNGVFWINNNDETLGATPAERFVVQKRIVQWATQSGPMLVVAGTLNPQISADGPSRVIRNGVGVRDDHTAFFVISNGPVSFGRLARFFRDALKCQNALYLDGVVSSAWIPALSRRDEAYQLGPMLLVTNR